MDNDALVRMVGGDMVETVVSHDIIGRLMIQCARQPGLASVWEQLLGFDGGCSQDNLAGGASVSHLDSNCRGLQTVAITEAKQIST